MYFDTAVAGYWRAMALPYHETMEIYGGDMFVRKATVEYHASARYDDRLDVGLRVQRIGNSSMLFVGAIFRGEKALVTGELVYVYADPTTERAGTDRRPAAVAVVQNSLGDRYEIRVPKDDLNSDTRIEYQDEVDAAQDAAGDQAADTPKDSPKGAPGAGSGGGAGGSGRHSVFR